jgi:glutathione S-transferase
MIGSMFIWRRIFTGGKPDRPKLEAYVDRLLERPAAMKFGP